MINRPIAPPSVFKPLESLQPVKSGSSGEQNGASSVSFEKVLGQALNSVNDLQNQAADLDAKLASGQLDYIHQAMIMSEKANLALDLTVQVRNKIIDAYQEIARTQI